MIYLTVVLLAIVIGYPVSDYYYMKKADLQNKPKMYWNIIIPQWVIVWIILSYWAWTGRSVSELFFVKDPLLSSQAGHLKDIGLGAVTAGVLLALAVIFSKKLKEKISIYFSSQLDEVRFMLPTTLKERVLFVGVALTAGFCEEVIFRGVMLYYVGQLPFDLSVIAIVIVLSMLFGIVHLYQGWSGVLSTAYLGGLLLVVYLITGNLWISIALHFLIDVKFVFFPNKTSQTGQEDG
ncbi:CPBP family intramembrane glutamic endopeptidase [Siminovitchia sediminis]|uniref:CPBP family intramembrane glutamic endopeptidase n=1 Tax=Siminovitchia sediminis TaxID=1274353 RepID=A0ABW4KMD5_9BACI